MIDIAASLKRIAWAYGCSRHGSDEESELLVLLLRKVAVTEEDLKCSPSKV